MPGQPESRLCRLPASMDVAVLSDDVRSHRYSNPQPKHHPVVGLLANDEYVRRAANRSSHVRRPRSCLRLSGPRRQVLVLRVKVTCWERSSQFLTPPYQRGQRPQALGLSWKSRKRELNNPRASGASPFLKGEFL